MALNKVQRQMLEQTVQDDLSKIGNLTTLTTTNKTNLVAALNELDSVKLEGQLSDTEIASNASIKANKLAIQQLYKKSNVSAISATLDTYGAVVDNLPATNFSSLVPLGMSIVFGGTFGTETATVNIDVTYSDATVVSIQKTATAIGTTDLTVADMFALMKDSVYITKISVKSKSSIASSTATVTVNHYGMYL